MHLLLILTFQRLIRRQVTILYIINSFILFYNNSSNQVMKLKNKAQIFIPDCVNKSTRCSRFQKENLCKNSQKIRNSCKSMCNLCGKLKEAFIYFSFQKIFTFNIYHLYAECLFMIIFSLRLQWRIYWSCCKHIKKMFSICNRKEL